MHVVERSMLLLCWRQVQQMVDAIGHATGVPPSANAAIEAAAMVGRANSGDTPAATDAHAGTACQS